MRGGGDVGEQRRDRLHGDDQFQQPDRIPPVGHRSDDPRPVVVQRLYVDALGAEHALVDAARQRHGLGLGPRLPPGALDAGGTSREPHDGATAEIGDQEGQLVRAEHPRERLCRGVHRLDRRDALDPVEQRADIQAAARRGHHGAILCRAFATPPPPHRRRLPCPGHVAPDVSRDAVTLLGAIPGS